MEEITESTATLSWSPATDNHSPISSYNLQARSPFSLGWQTVKTGKTSTDTHKTISWSSRYIYFKAHSKSFDNCRNKLFFILISTVNYFPVPFKSKLPSSLLFTVCKERATLCFCLCVKLTFRFTNKWQKIALCTKSLWSHSPASLNYHTVYDSRTVIKPEMGH